MKLSFSDRKWTAYSFDELLRAVRGTGVTGIELYSVRTSAFGKRLDEAGVKALRHQLRSAGICPVCMDSASDADASSHVRQPLRRKPIVITWRKNGRRLL